MKLLEVLPDVAQISQLRFSANFRGLLSTSSMEIGDALFIVHTETRAIVTDKLNEVLRIVAGLGKDCQVILIYRDGFVESCM